MDGSTTRHEFWSRKFEADLGLEFYEQDWGQCNADPVRVREFIAYYRSSMIDDAWGRFMLGELIFHSFHELLQDRQATKQEESEMEGFVEMVRDDPAQEFNFDCYSTHEGDLDDDPLAVWLQKHDRR